MRLTVTWDVVPRRPGWPDGVMLLRVAAPAVRAAAGFALTPLVWLRDLLTRLPRLTNQADLRLLTPSRWQPAA